MNFLIDAHLPRRLSKQLQQAGPDSIHTLDPPLKNRTPDKIINELSINELSINEQRVAMNSEWS
ncbi:MAG: DUF5615 family PIN-like protein [Blastocatellia bacterium]